LIFWPRIWGRAAVLWCGGQRVRPLTSTNRPPEPCQDNVCDASAISTAEMTSEEQQQETVTEIGPGSPDPLGLTQPSRRGLVDGRSSSGKLVWTHACKAKPLYTWLRRRTKIFRVCDGSVHKRPSLQFHLTTVRTCCQIGLRGTVVNDLCFGPVGPFPAKPVRGRACKTQSEPTPKTNYWAISCVVQS
jgi:hypothetical protein